MNTAIAPAFLSVWLWVIICIALTYRQRDRIIDNCGHSQDGSTREDWRWRFGLYDKVSFDSHLWRLMTLRNPYKLYHHAITFDLGA